MTRTPANKAPPRRFLRFSLKFLLVVFTGSCVITAWLTNRIPHCRAVEQLENIDADITWMREQPTWLDQQLGAWRFDRVKKVYYCGGAQTDFSMLADLNYLEDFSNFECLELDYSPLLKHADSIRGLSLDPLPENPESFFVNFPNLEEISIQSNFDLSKLKPLTKLKRIDCFSKADIEPGDLSAFTELEFACLIGTQIKSTRSLANLKRLETLLLDGCHQLEDLEGVEQLSSLKVLCVADCPNIRDLSPVGQCKNLEIFTLPNGNLSQIDGLKKLKSIYNLLENLKPEDLSVLGSFPCLEALNLDWSQRKLFDGVNLDLKLLGNKQQLQYLAVCRITDSDDLANFANLEKLVVVDSVIKDADSILTLENLKQLVLRRCEFSDTVLKQFQSKGFPDGFKAFSRRRPPNDN